MSLVSRDWIADCVEIMHEGIRELQENEGGPLHDEGGGGGGGGWWWWWGIVGAGKCPIVSRFSTMFSKDSEFVFRKSLDFLGLGSCLLSLSLARALSLYLAGYMADACISLGA